MRLSEDRPNTIKWTPSEEQGPGVFQFDVMVSDGQLETVHGVLINVKEVNAPPVCARCYIHNERKIQREIVLIGVVGRIRVGLYY